MSSASISVSAVLDPAILNRIFESQKNNEFAVRNTTPAQRRKKLERLLSAIIKYRKEIKQALFEDLKKPESETDMTEIFPVTSEIRHAYKQMSTWMREEKVPTPLTLTGSSSYIKYEPKGVVLILSPWNFPLNLTLNPLVSAIAAGNCVMIKPSENSPATSAVLGTIIREVFDENEVALLEGGPEVAQSLLKLPFNHIFFTGGPPIGKIVMEAAAKNLTSVTLELGGKSPCIVDQTANLKTAAARISIAKYVNAGQMCIAPDYVFVHKSKLEPFISLVKAELEAMYGTDTKQSEGYSRIINNRHFNRVKSYIEDALQKGAKIEYGCKLDDKDLYISPTILSSVDPQSLLMTEEIFGPVMPVFPYDSLSDVMDFINRREIPLAYYLFSENSKHIDYVMSHSKAGNGCINHCGVHFYNHWLPFGGANHSGIGRGHGFEGFKSLSNQRSVLRQHTPNVLDIMKPPYTDLKRKIIDLAIKYL